MAFLGKISAVLTASTGDFTRKIGDAKREINAFAQQARGVVLGLDNKVLNKTLTDLQRYQRTIQQIKNLNARGVGAGLPEPNMLEDLVKVWYDLGKPITEVKSRIEALSASVQAGLYPELTRLQTGLIGVYDAIKRGDTTFADQRARIDSLRQSLRLLSAEVAGVSDLDNLSKGLSVERLGASFFQPFAVDEMKRAGRVRDASMGLPAQYRNGRMADLALQQEEVSAQIAKESSRVARINARIRNNGGEDDPRNARRLEVRALSQERLDSLTGRLGGISDEMASQNRSAALAQIASPAAANGADLLVARLGMVASSLREIDAVGFNGLISSAAAAADLFDKDAASAEKAKKEVADLEKTYETYLSARQQQQMFLEASGGSSVKLSQGVRDAASDISVARQFRGQIASGAARISADRAIDSVTKKVTLLQQKMAEVAASDLLPDEKIRKMDKYDNEARQATASLSRLLSLLSGGKFSEDKIKTAMDRARNQAGSLSMKGSMAAQLAFQQGLFAIDDFMSATGGVEYKLRAIGNNITQLGLLLGTSGMIPGLNATTGLLIGLGAVMSAQLIPVFSRYVLGLESAEEAQKRNQLAAQVMNSSFERQRDVVQELVKAYRDLSAAAIKATETEQQKGRRETFDTLGEVRANQEAMRRERMVQGSPAMRRLREERASLEEGLKNGLGGEGARRRIAANENLENNQFAAVERAARTLMAAPEGRNVGTLQDLIEKRARILQSEVGGLPAARRAGGDVLDRQNRNVNARRFDLAVAENALMQMRGQAALTANEFTAPLTAKIESAQDRLSKISGGVETPAMRELARIGQGLAGLRLRAGEQGMPEREINRVVVGFQKQFDMLALSFEPLEKLEGSLDRASQAVDAFEKETGKSALVLRNQVAAARDMKNVPGARPEDIDRQRVALENQMRAAENEQRRKQGAADRGFELGLSPAQKARRDVEGQVADLMAAAPDIPGIIDPEKRREFLRNGARNIAEGVAPAVLGLAEQVQNAVLQGPSRASLEAADVSSVQGSRELNRLLRGQDSARDNLNLVELQKQNEKLETLVQVLKDNLGIKLDF